MHPLGRRRIAAVRCYVCPRSSILLHIYKLSQTCRQSKDRSAKNRREIVGDMIFLVRFPIMDSNIFAKAVEDSEFLTDQVYNYALFNSMTRCV